jgi:hypothetical protein
LTKRVLLDTGPIVAILGEADEHHARCVAQLRELQAPLPTCWPVLTEAAWMLRRHPAAIAKLMAAFETGVFELAPLGASDVAPIAAILNKYRNLGVQLADAALLHLANRESIDTVFTLDRRDFEVFRLKGGKRLRLIP